MSLLEPILLDTGVSESDLHKAKAYQNRYGGALERLLINMGSLSEESLPQIYSDLLKCPIVQNDEVENWLSPEDNKSLNSQYLLSKGWILYSVSGTHLTFACVNPLQWEVTQYINSKGLSYNVSVISEHNFELLSLSLAANADNQPLSHESLSDVEEDKIRELASEAPTVNLLNSLITRALRLGASDMHLEPYKGKYRVRFRVDGVLHEAEAIPARLQLPVVSRLKILSDMDIAEKRRPQDGKIEMKIANIALDIRVSALPLNDGESMVLRFLRKDAITYDIDVLGLSNDIEQKIREDLQHTAGVILLTGPTGSGKTTTLYTFLNELNDDKVKIITLEDPVEYQLEGVNQVQVKSEIGFDFSSGLRSIVRQDPDVIMVGEIRDHETARIAMQSALTGHLVFSTVHTNDAPSAYTRLLDLGVEEFLLNAALVSVIAQRLARKVCDSCSVSSPKQDALIEKYNLNELAQRFNVAEINLREAQGCEACANSGYKGRMAVIEYLRCDAQIRNIPKDEQFIPKAKLHNKSVGGRDLLEDGLVKAMLGQTTIDEVIRVCG